MIETNVSIFDTEKNIRTIKSCCSDMAIDLLTDTIKIACVGGEFLGFHFREALDTGGWADFCPHCGRKLASRGTSWEQLEEQMYDE